MMSSLFQKIKPNKKNNNIVLAENIVLSTNRLKESDRILFLTAYFIAYAELLPDRGTVGQFQQLLKSLIQSQVIGYSNLIQVMIETSLRIKQYKHNYQQHQILDKFDEITQNLIIQVITNKKYIVQKWLQEDKIQQNKNKRQQNFKYKQMDLMQQKQRNRLRQRQRLKQKSYNQQRINQFDYQQIMKRRQQEQIQTLRLIQKLKEQDQQQQHKRKQQQRKVIELLRQQQQAIENYQKKLQEQRKKQQLTCQICLEQIYNAELGLLECGHMFHKKCINQHIKAFINDRKVDIPCPSGCGSNILSDEVFDYIDGQARVKYEKFSFDHYVQYQDKFASWCPTAGCTAVFTHDGQLTMYRCPICKKKYCLNCKCDYHDKMTCDQFRINNTFSDADKKFEEFVAGAKFKQCPNCKFWVERTAGCVSMKCRCGIQFCYNCGGTTCPHGNCKRNL